MSTVPTVPMSQPSHNGVIGLGVYPRSAHLDAFLVLGLRPNASLNEVKSAYRKLALNHHPDKVQGGDHVKAEAHDKFSKISAAYELLTQGDPSHPIRPGTPYPVFFGTPTLLQPGTCNPAFSDPYELFRTTFGAQPNTVVVGDSSMPSSLFNTWTTIPENAMETSSPIAGYLTNGVESNPVPSEPLSINHMRLKRDLSDSMDIVDDEPMRKRQRTQPVTLETHWDDTNTLKRRTSLEGDDYSQSERQRLLCFA